MHMTASWFEELMGFPEGSYQETKRNLEVVGETLRSRVNGRTYAIGGLVSLIRFGGHVPKGGYDVPNGSNHTSAVTPAIQ